MFLNSSTLASLRFFAAAARALSFKQAAIDLHVTQGAVSQQINRLERALGVKLFHRLVRQVTLTDEGARLAATVQRSLDDLEQATQAVRLSRGGIDICLRAGPSLCLHWLVPRLGDFYARRTGIRLFVNAAYGAFDPRRPEFDLAIEETKGKVPGLHSEVLMDEYLIPVCSPEYLKGNPITRPKDLARCTLLHDTHPWGGASADAEWRYWLDQVRADDVDSTRGQFYSLSNLSLEAALTHQGVALGRTCLIKGLLDSGQLVAPIARRIKSAASYSLLCRKDMVAQSGIQTIVQWLREQARSMKQ